MHSHYGSLLGAHTRFAKFVHNIYIQWLENITTQIQILHDELVYMGLKLMFLNSKPKYIPL